MTDGEVRRRRTSRKLDRREMAIAALRDLVIALNVSPLDAENDVRSVLASRRAPLIDVRCSRYHKIGGVWRTKAGPLFLSLPAISTRTEAASRHFTVTSEDSRKQAEVDLLSTTPESGEPGLRCSCRCGLIEILDRAGLSDAVMLALGQGTIQWRAEGDRVRRLDFSDVVIPIDYVDEAPE